MKCIFYVFYVFMLLLIHTHYTQSHIELSTKYKCPTDIPFKKYFLFLYVATSSDVSVCLQEVRNAST